MGTMFSFYGKDDDIYNSFKAPLLICKSSTLSYFMMSNHLVQNYPTSTAAKERSTCSRRVKSPGYLAAAHLSARVLPSTATCTLATEVNHCRGELGHEFKFCHSLSVPQFSFSKAWPFLIPAAHRKRHAWKEIHSYTDTLQNKLCFTTKEHTVQECALRPR